MKAKLDDDGDIMWAQGASVLADKMDVSELHLELGLAEERSSD